MCIRLICGHLIINSNNDHTPPSSDCHPVWSGTLHMVGNVVCGSFCADTLLSACYRVNLGKSGIMAKKESPVIR